MLRWRRKSLSKCRVATWSNLVYLSSLRIIATRSLARSLAARAKAAERPVSRGSQGEQGAERGRCVSVYVYILHDVLQRRRVNAVPLPDSRFLDIATQIQFAR